MVELLRFLGLLRPVITAREETPSAAERVSRREDEAEDEGEQEEELVLE